MADISTKSKVCQVYTEKRKLIRTILGGTKAMIEAGETYTPKHMAENFEAYQARLNGTTLFNGTAVTINGMVGKVFGKNITLNADIPEVIQEQMDDIDGQGRNVTEFAMANFKDAMADGLSLIHVDFPKIIPSVEGEKPFLSDQIAQNARPNAISYKADDIIGFRHAMINGKETLTEIRIQEFVTEETEQYEEIVYEQIKVLRIGSFEIWRAKVDNKNQKEWFLFDAGFISLPYIPVVPIYTRRSGFFLGEPPLDSLAELNLEHWISSSEQRKALMFERFAMIVLTGVQPTAQVDIGPDQVIKILDPEAKWGKLESTGKGIEAGRLDLEAIERRMQKSSMTIQVTNEQGDVTATAVTIDSEESNAALVSIAGSLEDSLNLMLQIFADYQSLGTGGTLVVNKEFGKRKSTLAVTDMLSLINAGVIDEQVVFSELQRRGDLSEDLDYEEVSARARESMMRLMENRMTENASRGFGNDNEDSKDKDEEDDNNSL